MSIEMEPSADADVITVVLDPRIAYRGFGPDDGPLAVLAREFGAEDVIEDLADAGEQVDFAYTRAWNEAAKRMAPDIVWNATAPYHQSPADKPLLSAVAVVGREDRGRTDLIDQISAAVTVEVETLSFGATRWAVIDTGRMVGSATVNHTVMSVQDRHLETVADRIRDGGQLLRAIEHDNLTLSLYEPEGTLRGEAGGLGYVLTDRGKLVFAGMDFRPSPLHAIDSDRTVEALAGFLSLKTGDTDSDYFANYTERQQFWVQGDGPERLFDLVTDLPGDTDFNRQMAHEAEIQAEFSGKLRCWHVKPLERNDLPAVDLLGDSPSNARAQYPAYVNAWMDDTGREIDIDDDLFPALSVEEAADAIHHGQPVVSVVRGQNTLDWAVEHVNFWGTDAYVATGLIPAETTLAIPATGAATIAIRNATAVAHAGAKVEAHNRSRITALADSEIHIHPGAAVDRKPGSHVALAPESRMPGRTSAFRDVPAARRPLSL